jgi:sensor histidine kinase YesM
MMLLSLVENAIKHGLEPKPEGGRIDVIAEIVDGRLRVSVHDTGLGFRDGKVETSGTGVGLANIRERLSMLYGASADFSIRAAEGGGTLAVMDLPYKVRK